LASLPRTSVPEPPIGVNRYLGESREVVVPESDRRQHLYCVGQTGVGKSTLLRSMILGDIAAGRGVAVLDPHGDLFEDLLVRIPEHRWDDIVLLDPTDTAFPVGLNPLECEDDNSRHLVVREMRAIMARLLEDQYPGSAASFAGPMFFLHLEMNLLLTMSRPDDPGTLLEFYEIFQREDYWKKWLPIGIDDAILRRWVKGTLENVNYQQRGSEVVSLGEYVSSKFEDFVFDPRLRLLFGQKRSTIRISEILDEGKILLVNLSRGRLSESNSRFLGMLLMALFQSAASSRVSRPYESRKQFYLFVDEFQSISTDSFAVLLSEARKFGLGLVLANQFVSQIKNEKIMQAVFGNVATLVSFRVGEADATRYLEPLFRPYFDTRDLTNLPNFSACVRTTSGGRVVPPFSIETVPALAAPVPGAADEVRRRSRERYGRPKAEVEAEIERSLQAATD
jgi:type IV secretory pathway TraG/TraD family ATPase VirD4